MPQLHIPTYPADDAIQIHIQHRKPLQPKNRFPAIHEVRKSSSGLKHQLELGFIEESNKENHVVFSLPAAIQPFDASLADELSAVRKKNERMKLDWERTESLLEDRARELDLKMDETWKRGEIQRMLEIEVDRLFRLVELHYSSMKISPVRSLREKEREKKSMIGMEASPPNLDQKLGIDESDESVEKTAAQVP